MPRFRIQHDTALNIYRAQIKHWFWWNLNCRGSECGPLGQEAEGISLSLEDAKARIELCQKRVQQPTPERIQTVWQSWSDHGDYPGP